VSSSYDVRIWQIRVRKGLRMPYQVRWKVGMRAPQRAVPRVDCLPRDAVHRRRSHCNAAMGALVNSAHHRACSRTREAMSAATQEVIAGCG
jgi:hypothetical protein